MSGTKARSFGRMISPASPTSLHAPPPVTLLHAPPGLRAPRPAGGAMRAAMRDRSLNRKQPQRGRDLSIEAIQAVQALKRASAGGGNGRLSLRGELDSKFSRLLKLDMVAVLRELLRQNECALALKVFEDIRMECWYKPQVSLYADAIEVFAANGLLQQVKMLYSELKKESSLEFDVEGFNSLLRTFTSFGLVELALDCYSFMKGVGCRPEVASFRILISGLELMGETGDLAVTKQDALGILERDARTWYGESLEFLLEEEEVETNCCKSFS